MAKQWTLRCKKGFIVYHFGAGVNRVATMDMATIFTEELKNAWGNSVFNLAQQKGYEDLEWKKVTVTLQRPDSEQGEMLEVPSPNQVFPEAALTAVLRRELHSGETVVVNLSPECNIQNLEALMGESLLSIDHAKVSPKREKLIEQRRIQDNLLYGCTSVDEQMPVITRREFVSFYPRIDPITIEEMRKQENEKNKGDDNNEG